MRKASLELIKHLQESDTFIMADLYTITLKDSTVIRKASADIPLVVKGNLFESGSPNFSRSGITHTIGVEVAELELTIESNDDYLTEDLTWIQALRSGAFDGAVLLLERVFLDTWTGTPYDPITIFKGTMEVESVGECVAEIKVEALTKLLNIKVPRNLYMPSCINTLFDGVCGVLKSSNSHSGQIKQSTSNTAGYLSTTLTIPTGFYDGGTITFTSGKNQGISRTVKHSQGSDIALIYPLPNAPSVGDTFIAYPGCDKTRETCQSKFNNLSRFRGMPYIPMPESVVSGT